MPGLQQCLSEVCKDENELPGQQMPDNMYADYIFRLGRVPSPLLRIELNTWTIILTAILLTPLATVSAYHWPKKE